MLTVAIDTSGLNAAIAERVKVGRRTAAEVVNNSAYWVARNTINYAPASTVLAIDASLKITATANLTPSGNVGKKRYTSGNVTIKGKNGRMKEVPVAALIISARAKAGSRYNILTNNRWFLSEHPMEGKSRAAGRREMRKIINKMVGARHKSTSYLRSGFVKALRILGPYVQKNRPGGSPNPDRSMALDASGDARGDATVAQPGVAPSASISNLTGGEGPNAIEQNEYLWALVGPALLRALKEEEVEMRKYTATLLAAAAAKFNKHP